MEFEHSGSSEEFVQLDRNAPTISILAALKAGRSPPAIPMTSEKSNDFTMIPGESEKENASSEKDCQFMVEIVMNCRKAAGTRPATPPIKPRKSASRINA